MFKSMMKKISLFLSFLLIAGCPLEPGSRLYNPKPSDIRGQWETLSINQLAPYALLEFNLDGDGKLVFVTEDEVSDVVELNGFSSTENGFTINVKLPGENAEIARGSIVYGQLCFELEEDAELETTYICFTRADKIPDYRRRAIEKLASKNT